MARHFRTTWPCQSRREVTEALRSADALIHAAYDLSLTSSADIWRVNVEGTRRLLEAAKDAAVGRIIVLSSMSAFAGTISALRPG